MITNIPLVSMTIADNNDDAEINIKTGNEKHSLPVTNAYNY